MCLAGTRDFGLTFSNKGNLELIGYADASYLTHQDAKSHSGLAYSLEEGSFYRMFFFEVE